MLPNPEAMVLVTALKKYGMLVADNGSDWYVLAGLGQIHGSDFEVVDTGQIAGN